jgi:hypothetical protein
VSGLLIALQLSMVLCDGHKFAAGLELLQLVIFGFELSHYTQSYHTILCAQRCQIKCCPADDAEVAVLTGTHLQEAYHEITLLERSTEAIACVAQYLSCMHVAMTTAYARINRRM